MESGIFKQIREELFGLQDKETVNVIKTHRAGKLKPVLFERFLEKTNEKLWLKDLSNINPKEEKNIL